MLDKKNTPHLFVKPYRKIRIACLRRANRARTVKDVFTRIYMENLWGGKVGQYRSGDGSTEHHALLYADAVKTFIKEKHITSVADLGCGDFMVGSKLHMKNLKYIGVDIVEDLIKRNRQQYETIDIKFHCLDIITDDLPDAELCLIRQVLQHLSNSQIISILQKIKKYKYILITEHYPKPGLYFSPNKDKPHGPDTRIYDNSAVCLDLPPFNIKIKKMLLEVDPYPDLADKYGKLRTFLIEN
jgi:SAM-dependent methyltransferase